MDNNNLDLKYARKIEYSPGVPTPPSGSSRGKPGETYTFTTTSQDLITIKYNTVGTGTVIKKLINGQVFLTLVKPVRYLIHGTNQDPLKYESLPWMKKASQMDII